MIVACVRTGQKYGPEYVIRLRDAVKRHLVRPHKFVCLTDNPHEVTSIETVPVMDGLHGWWAKCQLFERSWRLGQKIIYLDLDTIIVDDLSPLADVTAPLAICANFTRLAGHPDWPCRYGSCAMVIGESFDNGMWDWFLRLNDLIIRNCGNYGDQMAIEMWDSKLPLLQELLPPGFFVGYRDLPKHKSPPDGCSVVVFAGSQKPHNTSCAWAREAWMKAA